MKQKGRGLLAALLAGTLAFLAGCGGSAYGQEDLNSGKEAGETIEIPEDREQEADYTSPEGLTAGKGTYIAMVLKNLDDPYWKAVREGAEKAVEDLNSRLGYTGDDKIQLTVDGVQGTGEEFVDDQINIIDTVLAENPSALCLAVIDRESCAAQIEAAGESEIPVIVLDSGSENGDADAVCMTDNEKAAGEAAERLCEKIGGKGQIAVFAHEESSQTSRERTDGFCRAVLDQYPQVEIVKVAYEEEGELPVQETLERYPDIRGIFCTSAGTVERVLEETGDAAGSEIQIVGFDANQKEITAVREGKLLGTVCQNPRGMGYVSVTAAIRRLNGQPVDARIDTGYVWLDQNNLENEENQKYLYDL